MKFLSLFVVFFAISGSTIGVFAARNPSIALDDQAVQQAIEAGRKNDPDTFGVNFRWLRNTVQIAVHSPETWIAYQTSRSRSTFKKLDLTDITDGMRKPVLRVVVTPASDSIKAVAVRSNNEGNTATIQPLGMEPCSKSMYAGSSCIVYVFDLSQVENVRQADKNGKGEFLVSLAAVGEVESYLGRYRTVEVDNDFRVKEDHLRKLGL
jgi:hypothetical protein